MEDADLGIYTVVVVGLFLMFGLGTFLQFQKMNNITYTGTERSDGARASASFWTRLFG